MFAVLCAFVFLVITNQTYAAEHPQKVLVNGDVLNVREYPSAKAKVVGKLKKGQVTYIHSRRPGGWAEIRHNNKRAFVALAYLKVADSYMPNIHKKYTYVIDGEKISNSYVKKYGGWDMWKTNEGYEYLRKEDLNGLYLGYPYSEYYTDIHYPIEIGKWWEIGTEGNGKAYVNSVSKTVKTLAGTFKNCVEVIDDEGNRTYYAKNVGVVKFTDSYGNAYSQLAKISNR
ncbi:SH3 domain-containing protein [Bacillus ectoiniformans]|uniref:SH3 domain-containing protein n=1 Tax=Bacillus ectoiniformans TaxID=1494429 RepID=UPI001EF7DD20|nr:SH3 domain-containing protein [Bacillus ectoiniformans]